MAKTNFSHGTIVTPEFLNTMYTTNGGHTHDGADADGHAPKINLDSHTTGQLDLETQIKGKLNLSEHSSGTIDLTSQVRGILPPGNYQAPQSMELFTFIVGLSNNFELKLHFTKNVIQGDAFLFSLYMHSIGGTLASSSDIVVTITPNQFPSWVHKSMTLCAQNTTTFLGAIYGPGNPLIQIIIRRDNNDNTTLFIPNFQTYRLSPSSFQRVISEDELDPD